MKVLVTGSSGFIGRHLVAALKQRRDITKVVGVSRKARKYPYDLSPLVMEHPHFVQWMGEYEEVNADLSLEVQVATLLLRYKPDIIFHLAGDPLVKNWGPTVTDSHVRATHNLLHHAPEGCRFVYAGSAAAYGDPRYPNHHLHENDVLLPTSAYGAAKAGAEMLVRAFTKAGKVRGLTLRLAATVGAGATHGLVPDLVRKLFSPSPTLDLLGDHPGARKPFTHVDDVVAGFVHLGLDTKAKGALNLAVGDNLSVADAALVAMEELGVRKPISWAGDAANWKGDNPLVLVDNTNADISGWAPKYRTSREAVAQAVRDLNPAKAVAA